MRFLNKKQKLEILEEMNKIYGIEELNYTLIEAGKQRIRAFSGDLSKEDIFLLNQLTNIEVIGMYFVSKKDEDARINFDALSLIRNKITKSLFEIDSHQLALWVRGYDLQIIAPRGILVLKFKDELVGVGKSNGSMIYNYLPKERKIKTPLPKS